MTTNDGLFYIVFVFFQWLSQMDLGTFINKSGCECLNESDDYHLPAALAKGPDYLESDCDEQVPTTKQIELCTFNVFEKAFSRLNL